MEFTELAWNSRKSVESAGVFLVMWSVEWGGSDALASSGMMNIMRRDGGRQVDSGTYDAGKLGRRTHGTLLI